MHPEKLRLKYNLTRTEAAFHIGISEYEMKAYSFRKESKHRRNPSLTVLKICELLDEKWQQDTQKNSN